jgi:hypothetical protein
MLGMTCHEEPVLEEAIDALLEIHTQSDELTISQRDELSDEVTKGQLTCTMPPTRWHEPVHQ